MASVPVPIKRFNQQDLSLHYAARNDDVNEIERLILSGVNIDESDKNGCTALIYASSLGNLAAVKLLLSLGANKSVEDNLGYDAYHAAMFFGDFRGATKDPFSEIMAMTKASQ